MNTPRNIQEFEILLDMVVPDAPVREMIKQFATEEFRRGYLHGKREMKMAAENALAALRVEEV